MTKMGFFNKKEKEKNVVTDVTKKGDVPNIEEVVKVDVNKDYPIIIQLNDIAETTTVRKKPFGAKRYIDGANVWLVNETVGFKEQQPSNNDDWKEYKLEEVESRIEEISTRFQTLAKLKKKKGVMTTVRTAEELDLNSEIKVLKGFKRSLELQGYGSYMIISEEHGGRPLYTFDRKGNFKLPVYKNVDYSLLHVPNESDIQVAGDLLKLNEDKNGDKNDQIKLANVLLTIILVLIIGFFGWLTYKAAAMPVEVVDGIRLITENMGEVTGEFNSLLDKMNQSITISEPVNVPTVDPGVVKVNN